MSEHAEGNSSLHYENQPRDFEQNDEYKSLLIVNDSTARVTLGLHFSSSLLRKFSKKSKIIEPKDVYLHREKEAFVYKIVINSNAEREKKEFSPGPLEFVADKLVRITESLECLEEKLDDYPLEKRVSLRKMHLRNELTDTSGKPNFYDILGLDMKDVRKKSKDDQRKAIKKAYREKIRIWHPDKNFGDDKVAIQIIVAKETLLDDERRARYHNEADYDKGWLSVERFKAIFWPDCFTDEQNKAYWRRIGMMLVSCGIAVGGIALTALTAGAAAPVAVVCGAVFGAGFTGAGMLSGKHTIRKESVVNECDAKEWLAKAGIGFLGGALTGGAAAGITAGVVGIGSAALESGAVSVGQYAGIGAGSGAVGGLASSVSSDAARKFVDGEDVTWKEFVGHAVAGAVVGTAVGAVGGSAMKGIVDRQTTAGSAALEGEMVEQAVILTGARRFGYPLARNIVRKLTESGTEAVIGTAAEFIEERLDDSVENRHPMEHLKSGAAKVGKTVASGETDGPLVACRIAYYEEQIKKEMKGEKFETKNDKQKFRGAIRHRQSVEKREHLIKWKKPKELAYSTQDKTRELHEDAELHEGPAEQPEEAKFKYKSEGAWISKMLINYALNGEPIEKEASGSGSIIRVPLTATDVEVKFQVRRPLWGDIMKYDRFEKKWCKPDKPHVFRYEKPPLQRTFTISGNLGWEAVMRVSDEYDEETREMDGYIQSKCKAFVSSLIFSTFRLGWDFFSCVQ